MHDWRVWERLVRVALNQGIYVLVCPLGEGLLGRWVAELRLIQIRWGLMRGERIAVLAHEFVHAAAGHRGPQSPEAEAWVDAVAAWWLIPDWEWDYVRGLCVGDLDCVAVRLGVPRWLVTAFQRAMREF